MCWVITFIQYDEGELYEQFRVFYNDVLPEFKMAGKVVQFKVIIQCICLYQLNKIIILFRYLATMSHILEGMSMYSLQRKFTRLYCISFLSCLL